MENVSRALLMAFSMLIFVIAFSYSMYLINKLTTTSNTLLESVTTTNYYDNIKIIGDKTDREVGIETIIPTLYRYYKESYAVKIIDKNGELIQLFDLTTEADVRKAAGDTSADLKLQNLKASMYNSNSQKPYLFESPWLGDLDQDARTRIDYFLNGTKGYIGQTLVDYSKDGPAFKNTGTDGFIKYGAGKKFTESFIEYAYEGETISTENRTGNDNRKYTRKFKNYHNISRRITINKTKKEKRLKKWVIA